MGEGNIFQTNSFISPHPPLSAGKGKAYYYNPNCSGVKIFGSIKNDLHLKWV
jgi:hypothetical protein